MRHHDPHSIYDPNSPRYDWTVDERPYQVDQRGNAFGAIWIGAFFVALAWSYVAPVYYVIAYILDYVISLSVPRWTVKWQGDSSTYTKVVAGLTILALLGGVLWLLYRVWRFIQALRKGY
jgi:hypothetical protein